MKPLPPIPAGIDPSFDDVKIHDSGEPLTIMAASGHIHLAPAYFARGYSTAEPTVSVRAGVIAALELASKSLPDGIGLLVWDGLRTLRTQAEIAARFEASLASEVTDPAQRRLMVQQYVSPLPRSEREFLAAPPPHTTGGAVDVTLCDVHGIELDLGAEFDQFDDAAWPSHFERHHGQPEATVADQKRRHLRRILHWAMIDAGFAPYAWEFWHFELGTRRAAAFYGRPHAVYGAAVRWEMLEAEHAH